MVIHIARSGSDDLVLKQVREQLNVAEPWYCSVNRIWREVEVLYHCATLLRDITTDVAFKIEVPRLAFEDRENYLYAMSAAPADHVVWKHELLSGKARQHVDVGRIGADHERGGRERGCASQTCGRERGAS